MKIKWTAIVFTIMLYASMLAALYITDRLPKRGANDLSASIMVSAISFIIIVFFLVRSIYMAIKTDRSYWIVTVVHFICFLSIYIYLTL
ncbi:MAG TPA: hypothetical protein PK987_01310 [Ferruginibacter sp.]|nr:hypothetical protein [Ferruginibacter sp.]